MGIPVVEVTMFWPRRVKLSVLGFEALVKHRMAAEASC